MDLYANLSINLDIMRFLKNTPLILCLGLIVGLIFDVSILSPYILYFLFIAMCISLTNFDFDRKVVRKGKEGILLFLLNYPIYALIFLGLSFTFLETPELLNGMILLTLAPPAVAIIPYTFLLKGDKNSSLFGEIFSYLSAFIILPLFFILLFGKSSDFLNIVQQIIFFLILPFLISRCLLIVKGGIIFKDEVKKRKMRYKKWYKGLNIVDLDIVIINLSFFLIHATVISINKLYLLTLNLLHPILLILLFQAIFPVFVFLFCRLLRIRKDFAVSASLFSGLKNSSFAIVLALTLFNVKTALPPTFAIILSTLTIILLSFLVKKVKKAGQLCENNER